MLGVSLFFVGITLLMNGFANLYKWDLKPVGLFNLFVGSLSTFIQLVSLVRGDYYNAGSGFLFAFTYLFLGVCFYKGFDLKAYGLFSLFVAINTLPFAYLTFQAGDAFFGVIWLIWGMLWLTSFIENNLGIDLGKFTPYFVLFCGVFTTWLPGLYLIIMSQ